MNTKNFGLFFGAFGLIGAALTACSSSPGTSPPIDFGSGGSLNSGAGTSSNAGDTSLAGSSPIAGTGGAVTAGGAGGAGGASGGASGGSGGAIPITAVSPSKGCGKTIPAGQVLGQYTAFDTMVQGKTLDPAFTVMPHTRKYFVWLPKDYDQSKPYRITYLFYGCGDRYKGDSATYRLMMQDPESIYVGMNMPPTGLPPAGKDCYDNSIGKQSVEWEFMGTTATTVQDNFCVDENREFVAGYSSGAWVSNMFGCYFAGKDPTRMFGPEISIRGQSTVTGGPVFPDVPCGGPVAALWIHDSDDHENVIGGNSMTSLPRVLAVNKCTGGPTGTTAKWGSTTALSDYCKQYTGCPADYPVIFCTTSGRGHSSQDDMALPAFIEFQNMMNPK